ncbi:MAG: outer membrane protein assembly factor BamB family protein [Planctomycetota bacterium]|jgi:outer membrane protein assembly factor BamB
MTRLGLHLRRAVGFLLLGVFLAVLAGCAEEVRPERIPLSRREKIRFNSQLVTKLKRLPLHIKWDTYVLGGELIRSVTMDEDLLLIETAAHHVVAMDRHKGVMRWIYDVRFPLKFQPAVSEEVVYLIARDVVHAVYRNGGAIKWKKTLPFAQGSHPAANKDYLFVAALDIPRVFAFKEETQVPKLTQAGEYHGALEAISDWFVVTEDFVRAAPLEITKGNTSIIYLCSFDHKVYALEGFTGKVTWTYKTGQQLLCSPYVWKDHIYVGGQDHTLHCLNRYGGPPPEWLFPTGGPIEMTPSADEDFVYVRAEDVLDEYGLPEDSYLYAVEHKSGKLRWRFRRGVRMLISGENKTYILREGNVLVILDKQTGKFLAEYPLPDFKFILSNDKDDILYLATDRGFFIALQETNPNPFR